jgi:thiol-disulfide isomerase/thioredoxin
VLLQKLVFIKIPDMRKILTYSWALLFLVVSCKKNQELVTLQGEITHYDNTPVLLIDTRLTSAADTLAVADGKFATTFGMEQPGFKTLKIGNMSKEIFVMPGYSLKISFDSRNIDSTFKMEGNGAVENSLHDSVVMSLDNANFDLAYEKSADSAAAYIDSIYAAINLHLDKLAAANRVSKTYLEYEKASLAYGAATVKIDLALEKSAGDTTCCAFLNQISVEKDQYLNIPNYREFLDYYLYVQSEKLMNKEDSTQNENPDSSLNKVLTVIRGFNNKKVADYMLFYEINQQLLYQGVKGFDKYYTYFRKHNNDSSYAAVIASNYAKKMKLAPGMPAPLFTCADIDSNRVSLESFKGKYVYIDFWATWCSPCRKERPYFLKLESDYKGKNIVFISISLDNNKKAWEDAVRQTKGAGISLIAEAGRNSAVSRAYQVSGIPTFVLIDKEGKIIDSQAERPSTKAIRETLDDLLK